MFYCCFIVIIVKWPVHLKKNPCGTFHLAGMLQPVLTEKGQFVNTQKLLKVIDTGIGC